MSEENSRTKMGLERVQEFYKNAQALLQGETEEGSRWRVPPVHTKIVGTRWHYNDLYGSLLERGFPSVVRRALEDDEPIFPTMFNHRVLEAKREEMGSTVFSSQMMNDPVDAASAIFKRENTSYYEERELPDRLSISITVDLAIEQKERADDTAIVVSGVCDKGHLWVLDYVADKLLPNEAVAEIYRLHDRWNAQFVYFESNNYQKAFKYIMHEEGKHRGHHLPVRPVRSKGTKFSRILMLEPFHEAGRLHLRRSHTKLEDQLHQYPKTRHDDVLDALATRVQRAVWAESNTGSAQVDLGEWSFARTERELDSLDGTGPEADLINPSDDFKSFWPE